MNREKHFKNVEEMLIILLGLTESVFEESQTSQIREFIDVGEYVLALEWLVGIVDEEDKRITPKAAELIYELVDEMRMDKSVFEEQLRGHIIDS